MNDMVLAGCRNDSLLGYLKSLGVLRLVASQADRDARGSWREATFVLHTRLEPESLDEFFLDSYAPTPIANPWNNGSGFGATDGAAVKLDRATAIIGEIRSTTSPRWAPYRDVLRFIFEEYVRTGERVRLLATKQKDAFIRLLRAQVPEAGLPWIDAAVGITKDDVIFPFLLGSGGNDGHFDFSVNFAERALTVIGERPTAAARSLLTDSLRDSNGATLSVGVAIGQFSPRHAGGVNASSAHDVKSLVNPWDYVFMLEGSLWFKSAVARRLQYHPSRSVFPFALRGVAGGYGSAAVTEESRGEIWLPIWDGQIGYAGLADLFRRGRLDLPSDGSTSVVRAAALASEGAAAALTMGSSAGIREFQRVAFLKRNGLSYTASASGKVRVATRRNPIVGAISLSVAWWIERVRSADWSEAGSISQLLRKFDDTLFAIAAESRRDAKTDQRLLSALAELEYTVARRMPDHPSPLPYLDAVVIDEIRDTTPEHRLAAALASLGETQQQMRVRLDLEHASYDASKHRLIYDRREPLRLPDVAETLSQMCLRRMLHAKEQGDDSWLHGSRSVGIDDIAAMLESASDGGFRTRLRELLSAYAIVAPPRKPVGSVVNAHAERSAVLPAAYALLKVVLDHPKARDPRIIAYLCARDVRRALDLGAHRASLIDGLPARFRDISGATIGDPRWLAATLLVPIDRTRAAYYPLISAALVPADRQERTLSETIQPYLETLLPGSRRNEG